MAGVEGRNRLPFADVRNVAPAKATAEGKNVRRPPTRSFAALQVADSQTAAAVHPNPVSDLETGNPAKKARGEEKSRPTLTSTITARNKVAYWMSKMPPKKLVDIDSADVNNEFAVTDYVDDLYSFYKLAEKEGKLNRYMDHQADIDERMRAILIDWIIEVEHKFEFRLETLYLTINIVDRFLSVRTTKRKDLQLLGIGAMLVASKYEEVWTTPVSDLVYISADAYSRSDVLAMEKSILCELGWNLTVPTPYVFLVRFIKASVPDDAELMKNMVHFLAELGMLNYGATIYCPSMLAASAVYAARCTLKKTPLWDETLRFHTSFSEGDVLECARLLVGYHGVYGADHKFQAIFKKYSRPERRAVALLPPATSLLP